MDLKSKKEDIHTTLEKMTGMLHNIKQESEDWFNKLFTGCGLSGWLTSVLKTVLEVIFIIFTIIISWSVLKKRLSQFVPSPQVNALELPNDP